MLIREITLRNLLSFGPETPPFALRNLNVLIGPNGSGKSNFIEAIGLLQAAPKDIAEPIREGGGIREWIWKGEGNGAALLIANVPAFSGKDTLCHELEFMENDGLFYLKRESIRLAGPDLPEYSIYDVVDMRLGYDPNGVLEREEYFRKQLDPQQSVLSQLARYGQISSEEVGEYWVAPEMLYLESAYRNARMYRDWCFGRQSMLRLLRRADLKGDSLSENFENLGLVLNRLQRDYKVKEKLLKLLNELYPGITGIGIDVLGGMVQFYLEENRFPIPASRLSDGTLRFLCLLAILCHPKPSPLICIEEPELGMHPDALLTVCRLIEEASERTQLIITTHSEFIVDYFSRDPEAIVVCEKGENGTTMTRLDEKELEGWLKEYTLGNLWRSGQIGGNRW